MIKQIDFKQVGLKDAQAKLDADAEIRKAVGPIAQDTVQQMRQQMRQLGFFDTGKTDDSFKHRFRSRFGMLEGVSIVAQRNAFVLAHVGKDYRWQSVGGRYEITKGSNVTDFIFPHISDATEKIADVAVDINADLAVKRLFPTK